ncbi:putative glutamine amidotransferase class-II [Sinorhizobium phage phiM6]|nr:putative glutamine amidotransferase class-II [Sinorhizobium phage phiM6]
MCGVFGLCGPGIVQEDLKIFKELGTISQIRGREGAGVWQTKTTANKHTRFLELWDKSPSSWDEFMEEVEDDKSLKGLMNSTGVDVLMGHVRHPTKGKRTVNNAHPFVFKSLVGMHNGTLKDKQYQDDERTDSELLFVDIIHNGLIPTLRALDKNSAYTLVIYDREKQVLRFTRNTKRPLSFAILHDRSVLYWASEADMLKLVLNRRGLKHNIIHTHENKVYKVIPNLVTMGTIEKAMSFQFIVQPEEKPKEEPKVEVKAETKEDKEPKNFQVTKVEGNVTHIHPRVPFNPTKVGSSSTALVPYQGNPMHASNYAKPREIKGKRLSMRSFHTSCHCGAKTMNLMDTFRSKRGEAGFPKFDHSADKFWCDDCLKNSNEVGNA